jgi:hypothetical protein
MEMEFFPAQWAGIWLVIIYDRGVRRLSKEYRCRPRVSTGCESAADIDALQRQAPHAWVIASHICTFLTLFNL